MITADPSGRALKLAQVLEILGTTAPPEDRDLLLSFAPVVFADTPDRVALAFSPEALAARLRESFRFVVRDMPPPTQLYKGLPGIHVAARNPEPGAWVSRGPADGVPTEVTVIETHTVDTPFIFESIKNYCRRAGLRVFTAVHPVFTVRRQWERIVWLGGPHEEGSKESYTHFVIERIDAKERLRRLEHEVHCVLRSVFVAVEDFADMQRTLRDLMPRLRSRRGRAEEADSARAFLGWLLEENYVFQGLVKFRLGADGRPALLHETAAGVFTDPGLLPVVFPGLVEEVEGPLAPSPQDHRIVDIDYCHNISAIYHLEPLDDLVIREWAADGTLREATLVLGRFARQAFSQRAGDIPLLREKLQAVLAQSGALPRSHVYREMRALFNRCPTRELLYADEASLKAVLEPITYLAGDDEIVVHSREGAGYVALAVALSRLRYSYTLERDLAAALGAVYGPVAFSASADLGPVVLLLFYFESSRLERPIEEEKVRALARDKITTWEDRAAEALEHAFGEREGRRLHERHVRSEIRSGLYRESTPPDEVPGDIRCLESLESRLEVRVLPRSADAATLKIFSTRALGLTETLRTLANLGLEVTDDLRLPLGLPGGRRAFLFRVELRSTVEGIGALRKGEDRLIDALRALDEGRATEDPLNGLVLKAGLTWREVEVLRTLRNHLLQVRGHYNAETVNGVLLRNCPVAAALVGLFGARFDPALSADAAAAEVAEAALEATLEGVASLAEDEVLRGLVNLLRAVLRTNFYQRPERPVVALKVDSRRVEGLPSPRPLFEIYVHAPRLEGIHLRGGKVARGGIRWSDRHDDFRTEVLGLMKTQMVKNAIIVPVGSKGGFVLKGHLPARPALDQYLVDRYREFVSGLLDVTDNLVDGKVLHPPDVVRQDGDDPYLVVAADKGTAHLSDTANSVSAQYGFWLGDAFASGGSAGYDHKKMGITARGAWECVKHHFRNLGLDCQKDPFTAVGVGDMSGDVFGNGALLSPALRLVGAFDHRHVFLDPEPDAARSLAERRRLFERPRSSWRDYDASLLSPGGGVWDRSARSVPLSPEVRRLLGVAEEAVSGEELIRRLLRAPVDLLYNGGIGTYVKASAEDDAAAGDRANDRVRVDARDVRARVVGEGGNLGFTQRGRIEYWAAGGAINTDAVDNSGGVDTSDHEVNIKILMGVLLKKGRLSGREERNRILAEMTEEVAALVLADNANQARALTLDSRRSLARYEEFVDLIEDMAGAGIVNRADDAIPGRTELLDSPWRPRGLPRPLLAVLLGNAKMWAFQMLMETDFPDSPAATPLLDAYFPARLHAYREDFAAHALRREIVATAAVNQLVNGAGVSFLPRLMGRTRAGLGEIVAAYFAVERESGADGLRARLAASGLAADVEHEAWLRLEEALEEQTVEVLAGRTSAVAGSLEAVRASLGA
jgi:glutamate dehydrogenase